VDVVNMTSTLSKPDKVKSVFTQVPSNYVYAKYIRLSLDDGVTESLSIPNQHMILDEHIDEMEIPNATVLEFVDNGFTGMNMERPALQEMLDLARSGRINCIIVKDFSRFSRNALESGYYIEQVFPLFQIRFISVSDRFDSNDYKNDTGGIDVAFKFLMHEYYSQDLSKKVKSALRIKMARGENIVAKTIYGYYKDEAGKWEPEDGTADVIRYIYELAMQGFPPTVIKDKLFQMGYPTPKEHQELKRGKEIVPTCLWETRKVKEILRNEQYIGSYISGKQNSKGVGLGQYWTDESEWIVIPDSHTPIISKETFDLVQNLMDNYIGGRISQKPLNETWKEEVAPLIDEPRRAKSQSKHPKRRRMLSGDFIAAVPIYGYSKMDDGSWELDPIAADVIRNIFDLALHGVSAPEIAEQLSAAGHPMPREHINLSKGQVFEPTCQWRAQNVRNIIGNIQYTGAYVSGRILKDSDTGESYRTSKEDWIIIPDKNPAIISQDSFDRVQEVVAEGKKSRMKNKQPRDYLLRSKVKCGCCKNGLVYDPIFNPVFRCYQTAADPSAPCNKMKVLVSELDEAVLDIVRKQAEVILNTTELTGLRKPSGNVKQIAEFERQLKSLVEQRQTHYEQFVNQEIDREAHQSLRADLAARIERLNTQLAAIRQSEYDSQAHQKTALHAKAVLGESMTQKEIVDLLIDKIHVFPDDRLEITWKVAGFAVGM
jgi:DNA invertase Pin-like site-specific DNA recombinase